MYTPFEYYTSIFEIIFKKSENLTKTPRQLARPGRKQNEMNAVKVHINELQEPFFLCVVANPLWPQLFAI